MSEVQPPVSASRWRSGCGCSGCALLVLIFVGVGVVLASIGLDITAGTMRPPSAFQATGVVLRTLLNYTPPSTEPPDSVTDVTATNGRSPEEVAYLNTFDWDRYWVSLSEQRLHYLDLFSSIWSSRWKSQLASEAAGWHQLYANVQQLEPPEDYDDFHARFVDAFRAYDAAADDIDRFVQDGDQDALDDSTAKLQNGDALIAEARQVLTGSEMNAGSSRPGPAGSSDEMIAGLAREDDLPAGWSETSIPEDYPAYGPLYPCDATALFFPDEIDASAGVSFETQAVEDGYLQEILVHVGEHTAATGMLAAKADFPCEPWTDDDGYSYHTAPLDVPLIGDDTIGYQYTDVDADGNTDTVTNVILVRVGGLVIEVWQSQTGSAPALDETEQMARIMMKKAQSIPIDPEPDPGNGIQVERDMKLPAG